MKLFNAVRIERINRTAQIARYWSNRELKGIAKHLGGAVVNVSGWKDEDKEGGYYREYFPEATSYAVTNMRGDSGFQGAPGEILLDLRQPLADELRGKFDVVLSHTTLEHVFEVHDAFGNLAAMTRDVLIVVVPFCQNQHERPSFGDYWRFTPSSLRELSVRNGLSVVYESCNEHFAAANYLLCVSSRRPEQHLELVKRGASLGLIGSWIGKAWWQRAIPYLWVERL